MFRRICLCLSIALPLLSGCGGGSSTATDNSAGTDTGAPGASQAGDKSGDENPAQTVQVAYGLQQRPANAGCLAPARQQNSSRVALQRVFPGLAFVSPLALLQAPGDSRRWFVVEKAGRVQVFDNHPDATVQSGFIDIRGRVSTAYNEAGLLGMAFHPDFGNSNDYVYLSYTANGASGFESRISRFQSNDNGLTLDPASEEIILRLDQPAGNHNGGHIAFGPDGFLYIGFGDGGGAGDPDGNGQNTDTLLGALLRIDVNVSQAEWNAGVRYRIPAGNPFASSGACGSGNGCPEIYAWGLRNPWRWSFDRDSGDLWLGDVGQYRWEEIDLVRAGGNYGWRFREGAHCYNPSSNCPTAGLIDPVVEYANDGVNKSVTGGYVYRGSAIPALSGQYIFGDVYSGRIWSLDYYRQGAAVSAVELTDSNYFISSFGEDKNGELYIVDMAGGGIYQLVDAGSGGSGTVAASLSETGCVDKNSPSQAATGVIPFSVNAEVWMDGATQQRFLALPDNTGIQINTDDSWNFPPGSVLMKHLRLDGKLVETRLLMRHPDGQWAGYSYEWDDAQSDAMLLTGSKRKTVNGQTWAFPGGGECMSCHNAAAGVVLGAATAQMNRDFTYPSSSQTANQLSTYEHIGLFAAPLNDIPSNLSALADPDSPGVDLDLRARAYLHANCAHCHQSGGTAPADFDVHYATEASNMNLCDVLPLHGDLGVNDARIAAAGDPARSILWLRMQRRDINGMPPLGSNNSDAASAAWLADWITALRCL